MPNKSAFKSVNFESFVVLFQKSSVEEYVVFRGKRANVKFSLTPH